MSLTALGLYHDRFEAQIVCGRLRSEGIDAIIFDGGLGASYGNAFPVRLMVPEDELEPARAILRTPVD